MISKRLFGVNDIEGHLGYTSVYGSFLSGNVKKNNFTIQIREDCRELFEMDFYIYNQRYIGFIHRKLNIPLFNRFWSDIERKVGLKGDRRTMIYKTKNISEQDEEGYKNEFNTNDVIVLRLSPFWIQTNVHISLLSLFLRLGVVYYKGNFDTAVKSYGLAHKVNHVIDWFLNGNTKIAFDALNVEEGDFVNVFGTMGTDDVHKLFVKPNVVVRKQFFINDLNLVIL